MADYYNTGTVSVIAGSTAVTLAGGLWSTIRAGDTLELAGQRATLAAIGPDFTSATLAVPWAGANQAGAAYVIRFDAPERFTSAYMAARVRELVERADILRAARPNYEVQSLGANAPPGAPVTGDLYVIGTAPTGAWAGQPNNLAQWTGSAWLFTAAERGATVVSAADGRVHIWSGSTWGTYVPPSGFVETLMDDANADAFLATLGFSAFMRSLRDDADQAAARTTLGAQATLGYPPIAGVDATTKMVQGGTTVVTTDAGGNALINFPVEFGAGGVFVVAWSGSAAAYGGVRIARATGAATNGFIFNAFANNDAPLTGWGLAIDWIAVGNKP